MPLIDVFFYLLLLVSSLGRKLAVSMLFLTSNIILKKLNIKFWLELNLNAKNFKSTQYLTAKHQINRKVFWLFVFPSNLPEL